MGSKDLSGVKHVRLDMTARDKGKGGPDKGHTTKFSPSKVVNDSPNFRSYFGMEYEQPWNMSKILLESFEYGIYVRSRSWLLISGGKKNTIFFGLSQSTMGIPSARPFFCIPMMFCLLSHHICGTSKKREIFQ